MLPLTLLGGEEPRLRGQGPGLGLEFRAGSRCPSAPSSPAHSLQTPCVVEELVRRLPSAAPGGSCGAHLLKVTLQTPLMQ